MRRSTIQPVLAPAPPDTGIAPRRWTRREIYLALDAGVFGPEERLELLDGEILARTTQTPLHAASLGHVAHLLGGVIGPKHHVRQQVPVILDRWNEPEPDVSVVVGTINDYLASHPKRTDASLLVEVSDTTLVFDRGRRCAAYARAGVPDYWLLNLLDEHLEIYRNPWGSRYRSLTVSTPGQEISPLAFPGVVLPVADLILSVIARAGR